MSFFEQLKQYDAQGIFAPPQGIGLKKILFLLFQILAFLEKYRNVTAASSHSLFKDGHIFLLHGNIGLENQ